MGSVTGMIFNIQKFSVHDGPGIRSIVFFKGCPLRCRWCSNPEGIAPSPQLAWKQTKCIGVDRCGRCVDHCPLQAVTVADHKPVINRDICNDCGQCEDICPSNAMELLGKRMTVAEVMEKVMEDDAFYAKSGGGMTLSGGEPLLQPEFAKALLEEARRNGISTAIETTGCVSWEKARPVLEYLDFIHYDLKSVDEVLHRQFTGTGCQLPMENLKRLCREFADKDIIVRTPVIPGFNDTVGQIQAIADYIGSCAGSSPRIRYELLPYHAYGSSKYEYLGLTYPMKDLNHMDRETIEQLKRALKTGLVLL